ncbi:MAG: helix-turn-helix transcriptional regulator [Deltaproteobacteria bacterium]|nr:helix-turn-helix transcriptional regulator [Deltaproteobacteria bacterium]
MARAANPETPGLIKAAALVEFGEHGLAQAKVSAIAERAGISKGAFYLYYESKEALYVALAREFLDEVVAHLSRHACAVDPLCADAAAIIQQFASHDAALIEFFWSRRPQLSMVFRGAMGTNCAFLFDEFIDAIQRAMHATIAAQPVPTAHEPALPPEFLAAMATGLLFMHVRRILGESDPPEVAHHIHQFRKILVLGMLLPPRVLDAVLEDPLTVLARLAGEATPWRPGPLVALADAT